MGIRIDKNRYIATRLRLVSLCSSCRACIFHAVSTPRCSKRPRGEPFMTIFVFCKKLGIRFFVVPHQYSVGKLRENKKTRFEAGKIQFFWRSRMIIMTNRRRMLMNHIVERALELILCRLRATLQYYLFMYLA